jgi:hypothetical protein
VDDLDAYGEAFVTASVTALGLLSSPYDVVGACPSRSSSSEGEDVRMHPGVEEGDLERAVGDRAALADQRAAMPDEAARDLHRLLSYDLASRNTARLRLGHLRLLIEMLGRCSEEAPFVNFSRLRRGAASARGAGRGAPDGVGVARGLRALGEGRPRRRPVRSARRCSARQAHTRARYPHRSYNVEEIQAALRKCFHGLGTWPTEWEYSEWAAAMRVLAQTDPRLPVPKQIRKAFGSFDDAVDVTRSGYEARRSTAQGGASTPKVGREPHSGEGSIEEVTSRQVSHRERGER